MEATWLVKKNIYIRAGPEFGPELQGKILILEGALYGAKGSANAWFLKLSDYQRTEKFNRSTMDMSFWYKYIPEADQYNYFCHHVDDILNSGPGVTEVIRNLKKNFTRCCLISRERSLSTNNRPFLR